MRIKHTTIFTFDELDDPAKEKAREWYRDGALDYDWWEFIYSGLENVLTALGGDIDLKKTYFSGFYHQGSGSSFTGNITARGVLAAIDAHTLDGVAPELRLPKAPTIHPLIRKAIDSRAIEIDGSCCAGRGYGGETNLVTDSQVYSDSFCIDEYPRIDAQCTAVAEWLEEILTDINHCFFTSLEHSFEYLTSDECVDETILANAYEFDASGHIA